jgi:hypothetical protein
MSIVSQWKASTDGLLSWLILGQVASGLLRLLGSKTRVSREKYIKDSCYVLELIKNKTINLHENIVYIM